MLRRRVWRIAIAALFLPLMLGAALTARDAAPSASLAGQLLIASRSIGDPRFEQTVILMVKHDRDGAFGIIINRPVSEQPLSSLLEAIGEPDPTVAGTVRIHAGGPVEPSIGFVLHGAEYKLDATIAIDGRVAMSSNRKAMRDIAYGRGPKKFLIAFGYAGWAPGQLEGEIANGGWHTRSADLHLVFDSPRDTLWRDAMATRTRDL
ncbi:MAG TPA: YqgE/AlgH family protein [Alphaproteobacteria bacterium]